jgi:hypothetical protein
MSEPLTPEDIKGWYDINDVFEKRMVLLCAALLPRERRLIEHAIENLPKADFFEVRVGGSPRTEVFSKADVQEMWDLFDNAWVGPESGTTLTDLAEALVSDLIKMDKSTAIELASWPAAKDLVKALRPAWRSTRRKS